MPTQCLWWDRVRYKVTGKSICVQQMCDCCSNDPKGIHLNAPTNAKTGARIFGYMTSGQKVYAIEYIFANNSFTMFTVILML